MNSIRNFLLIISSLLLNLEIMAQTGGVIRGRIIDKSEGDPLPGVNVVELDNQNRIVNGVITDLMIRAGKKVYQE